MIRDAHYEGPLLVSLWRYAQLPHEILEASGALVSWGATSHTSTVCVVNSKQGAREPNVSRLPKQEAVSI